MSTMVPQHVIEPEKGRTKGFYWRYWRTGGSVPTLVAVVAVVNSFNGQPKDWAVYIGGQPDDGRWVGEPLESILYIAKYGAKMTQGEAEFFFSALADIYYRP